MSCPKSASSLEKPAQIHEHAGKKVLSKEYLYSYDEENHLMFREFRLADQKPGHYPYLLAKKSDQLILGDLKNFLTLAFDAHDVEAIILNERPGPVALVGRLSFVLQILMFEIDLELWPEVSFYKNGIHVPMVLQLPVNAPDYLNPGSGLYYTWEPGQDSTFRRDLSRIPSYGAQTKEALSLCVGERCLYKLVGMIGFKYFAMEFAISRGLVSKGFYPQFIQNLKPIEGSLGRELSRFGEPEKRVGVFFETSQLNQGAYGWDFWLHTAEQESAITQACFGKTITWRSIAL